MRNPSDWQTTFIHGIYLKNEVHDASNISETMTLRTELVDCFSGQNLMTGQDVRTEYYLYCDIGRATGGLAAYKKEA